MLNFKNDVTLEYLAKIAVSYAKAGIDMVIANGENPLLLYDIVDGKDVGTRFLGKAN